MLRIVFAFLLLCIGTCSVLADDSATPSRSGEGLFALRSCESGSPCVYGRLQQGTALYLLGINSSRVCRAFASEAIMAGFEAGDDFPLTPLRLERCKGVSWRLAVVQGNRRPSYSVIRGRPAEARTAREIEKQIRLRATEFEKDDGEHPIRLSPQRPRIFSLPAQAKGTYLVSFENISGAKDPTYFLFAQGRVELIHGAAKLISTFILNGNSYGHFQFTCWVGCGWGGDFVLEFSGTKFRAVMYDDSGST